VGSTDGRRAQQVATGRRAQEAAVQCAQDAVDLAVVGHQLVHVPQLLQQGPVGQLKPWGRHAMGHQGLDGGAVGLDPV
jgi:hypothetical protein